MIFSETKLKGAFLVEPEKIEDGRGFFARVFDTKAFREAGIRFELVESSISFNKKAGTLRGMHYQTGRHGEAKLVRCTRGRIFDVIVDLRPSSKTFRGWFGTELSEHNFKTLYIPRGFAHGFVTLEDDCEVSYHMDQKYSPKSAAGIRWDDKKISIRWPTKPVVISKKDMSWEPLK